ncbi:phosphatidylserine decarboxylase [Helicobacter sp. 13S00477-4]|uniref:phosphatidylserine decarboxylase n=1 Tax=Helicobacter sp. 13S00477-4 TaxID=1905759 RepID=UPI000BA6AA49|nr:phosphatidylserine decarboxylase [Helicobacter sp. 13S00477-4]PAF52124.1 phosphatidylserine decarboxylase [Helicobacter sp. 13S00477-4]
MKWSNRFSKYFGNFANKAFPRVFQNIINIIYVKIFNIDLSDFAPIESYKSLNELFTRYLRVKRDFDNTKDRLISPCDSLITQHGEVFSGMALQIKGMQYNVKELLGEEIAPGYFYFNFYLSPSDYHHYHSPCDLEVLSVRYFAGELLPVNKPSLKKNIDLFIKNERVVVIAKDFRGELFYFVAIGALNVGQMVLNFEPAIQTNTTAGLNAFYKYENPIIIHKGQEIGMFKMGSTVVIFAKGLKNLPAREIKVKFGDTIATLI